MTVVLEYYISTDFPVLPRLPDFLLEDTMKLSKGGKGAFSAEAKKAN